MSFIGQADYSMPVFFMKFDFPKKIRSGYLVAFILLLICYFLSLSSFINLRSQNKWVGHTREVLKELDALNANLKDAEIDWREYLLNEEKIYLSAYNDSKTLVDSVYTVLIKSVSDDPEEEKRVAYLHDIILRKYRGLDEELKMLSKNNFQVNDSIRSRERLNKALIDSIDRISDSITANENRLLHFRTRDVMFSGRVVFWIIIGAGLISILLIIYSLITFNIESKAKKTATRQAETYHDQLEKRILELASANRELMELRSLERFTSTGRIARVIAHEIRNPLTNIDLSTAHLENSALGEEDKKVFLDIIARNSRRINELINELLSATKFSELKYEEIQVDDLLDDALSEAMDRARLNQVSINKNYSDEKTWLSVDKSRMKIALLNIVVNAMEAITGGGGRLDVETMPGNDHCTIIIRDNGKGMNPDTLAKVFDPYFTSKSKGNGLGMTNTQNIILNHKGKIEVFSEEGKGTSFIITMNRIRKKSHVSV